MFPANPWFLSFDNDLRKGSFGKMVGARGFEPPTPWSRNSGQGLNRLSTAVFEGAPTVQALLIIAQCAHSVANWSPSLPSLSNLTQGCDRQSSYRAHDLVHAIETRWHRPHSTPLITRKNGVIGPFSGPFWPTLPRAFGKTNLRFTKSLNEFYKKGCQEKSSPLDRTRRRFSSRDPAHCL